MVHWFFRVFFRFKFLDLFSQAQRTNEQNSNKGALLQQPVVTGSPSTHNNVKNYENQGLNLD